MAQVVTFDPVNLLVVGASVAGATVNDTWTEIYSEWKNWLLADQSRLGHPPAFIGPDGSPGEIGGQPTTDTEAVGITRFFNNSAGWRLCPAERDHHWVITGNTFGNDFSLPLVTPTQGGFTVLVEMSTSLQVQQVTVGGGGGGTADWTSDEREQLRYRIGIDGTKQQPSAGSPPDLAQEEDVTAQTTTLQGDIAASQAAIQVDVANLPTALENADAVWDEARSGHATAGTFGATSEWASTLTVSGIAAGVWDRQRSLSVAPGSFGAVDEWTNLAPAAAAVSLAVWSQSRGGFATGTFGEVSEWTGVPVPAGLVADAVWDEPRAAHATTGTFGATSEWTGTGADAATVAAAVLDELLASHTTAGSLGQVLQRVLDVIEADLHVTTNGTVLEIRRRSDNALLFSKSIAGGNTIDVVVEGS